MIQATNRRDFIKVVATAAAGTAVVGFSANARAWVRPGHGSPFHRAPSLDGELVTDAASLAEVGKDRANIVFTTPSAVLRPGSVDDVVKMVRFCGRHCIKVVARGQGHATDGQAQVDAGLVIDMRTLDAVREIGSGYALVEAGSTWRALLVQTLAAGQTPPVLTGYTSLSIGGTLSMGGISGIAYKRGVQVDNVLELTVVTGRGRLEVCSRTRNRALFDVVLAGIGQYAIIVSAKLKLVAAKTKTLDWTIRYDDYATFSADMRMLVRREELDSIYGGIKPDPVTGGWYYELYTAQFYSEPSTPDMTYLHRGLSYAAPNVTPADGSYFDFLTRVDNGIAFLTSIGVIDGFMKPWFDVFLPNRALDTYVQNRMASLAPDDVGTFGFVLLFPLKRSTAKQPLFRLPDDDIVFLFDITTSANFPGFEPTYAAAKRARNGEWFEEARAVGGTRYPIGTLTFDRDDWRRHYGPEWLRVNISKTFFDPDHLLTPGPGVFEP